MGGVVGGGGVVGRGGIVETLGEVRHVLAMNLLHPPIVCCVPPCYENVYLVEIDIHEIADSAIQAPPRGVESHPLRFQKKGKEGEEWK